MVNTFIPPVLYPEAMGELLASSQEEQGKSCFGSKV